MATDNDDDVDVADLKRRQEQVESVHAGTLPPTESRLAGFPPCRNSEDEDRRLFVQSLIVKHEKKLDATDRSALELAAADGSVETLTATLNLLDRLNDPSAVKRFELYSAMAGDARSALTLGQYLVSQQHWRFTVSSFFRVALGLGLLKSAGATSTSDSLLEIGTDYLQTLDRWMDQITAASSSLESSADPSSESTVSAVGAPETAEGEITSEEMLSDRHGLVVVPAYSLDRQPKNAAREVAKSLEPISAKRLPLVRLAEPASLRPQLAARFPHLEAELDIILRQPLPWRLLLVGRPGIGKTELSRELLEAAGLPYLVYGCAGASDSSFGGTSAQWGTARPSIPLQLIHRHRVAGPAVLLDELDKTSLDRRNGALVETLLNFLEPVSSSRVMDLGLELEVNLSQVSYVCTANDLDNVPVPLRDRLKIIRVPSPGVEHVEKLVRTIFDDIAAEQGVDRRWLLDLAQDELELLRDMWPGGSLRRLRRIVVLLIEARDRNQTAS